MSLRLAGSRTGFRTAAQGWFAVRVEREPNQHPRTEDRELVRTSRRDDADKTRNVAATDRRPQEITLCPTGHPGEELSEAKCRRALAAERRRVAALVAGEAAAAPTLVLDFTRRLGPPLHNREKARECGDSATAETQPAKNAAKRSAIR